MKVSMLMKEYIDSEDRRAKARHNGLLPDFILRACPLKSSRTIGAFLKVQRD